ncbi:MAG: DNA polymerase III subunit epsilon [Cellulomonadaceae bacterium]|nr:DNA polymerase III subunit epsilon [Cellulomonadaceae bacterium]
MLDLFEVVTGDIDSRSDLPEAAGQEVELRSLAGRSAAREVPHWTKGLRVGFDTETTGVDPATARIVSAAVVHRVPDTMTEVKVWLIDPGVDIPAAATAVHGFTTEYVREHGQPAAEALNEIAEELASQLVNGAPVVVYNATYDLPLLETELRRYGLPSLRERMNIDDYHVLDPLVLDRWVDKYRKGKRKLGDLVAHYGISVFDDLHTADIDVLATLDVLEAMTRKWPQIGVTEIEHLQAIQVNAHHAWAQGMNEWFARNGINRAEIPTGWFPTAVSVF